MLTHPGEEGSSLLAEGFQAVWFRREDAEYLDATVPNENFRAAPHGLHAQDAVQLVLVLKRYGHLLAADDRINECHMVPGGAIPAVRVEQRGLARVLLASIFQYAIVRKTRRGGLDIEALASSLISHQQAEWVELRSGVH